MCARDSENSHGGSGPVHKHMGELARVTRALRAELQDKSDMAMAQYLVVLSGIV